MTLTTSADVKTGGDTNDTIIGYINNSTTSLSTFSAADSVNGGAGTDTIQLTVEGDVNNVTEYTLTAAAVSGVENVQIRNISSDTVIVNAANFSGSSEYTNDRSTAQVTFNNIGTGDVTVVGDGTSTNGTTLVTVGTSSVTDALTLNIESGVTAGDITFQDADADWSSATINSTGAENTVGTVDLGDGDGVTALTINATTGLTATAISGFKSTGATITIQGSTEDNVDLGTIDSAANTVNASGLTAAGLTATTNQATDSIVGGQGNDVITLGVAKTTGTTALGSGSDTVITTADAYIDETAEGNLITGAEKLQISNTISAADSSNVFASRTQDVSKVSGITSVGISTYSITDTDNADDTTTSAVTFTNLSASVSDLTISGLVMVEDSDDDEDNTLTVTASRATDTSSDQITVTLGTSTAASGGVEATTSEDDMLLALTLDNEETINFVSQGGANGISALSAADATTLTVTGSKALTVTGFTSANITSVNASAATGAFKMGAAASNMAVTITGGSANDTLVGGTGADSILGNAGEDSITAGSGNDYLEGGAANDTLAGEDGADTIVGGDGVDAITGGSGMDNLSGGAGNDTFTVAANADFVSSTGSIETVTGGDGIDKLKFSNNATVDLSAASLSGINSVEVIEFSNTTVNSSYASSVTLTDAVYAANGLNTLTVDATAHTSAVLTVAASNLTTGKNVVVEVEDTGGTYGAHSISLGAGNDVVVVDGDLLDTSGLTIAGGSGVDTLRLETGNNAVTIVAGVTGFENVTFGTASDGYTLTTDTATVASGATLTVDGSNLTGVLSWTGTAETNGYFSVTGGAGADTLIGGSLADTLSGGSGSDSIAGGSGADSITGGDAADSIDGGDGNDIIDAGAGNDASIVGGAGSDNLSGGAGNDTFIVGTLAHFTSLSSVETVSGGSGNDILKIGVTGSIAASDLTGISSIETIEFSSDDAHTITLTDTVMAANGNSTITIDADAMLTTGVLTVNAGNLSSSYSVKIDTDATASNAANDITLGAGNDTVILDVAALDSAYVTLEGGSGTDTLQLSLSTPAAYGTTTIDSKVTGFEVITFGTDGLTDDYNITTVTETVASGATLTVSGGSLTTGTLKFNGSAETNGYFVITSGGGNDSITGGTLADTISSGSGADTITGGLGADSITGGAGADLFVYANVSQSGGTAVDTITDWTSASDKLQVTLDYSAQSTALDVNAVLLGTGVADLSTVQDGLTGKRGEYQYVTGTSQLVVNFNNDNLITAADYKIGLAAASTASATVVAGDVNFSISGGSGADSIVAGGGADTISGGSGADTINGGAGADALYGDNTGTKEIQTITLATAPTAAGTALIKVGGHSISVVFAAAASLEVTAATIAAAINADADLATKATATSSGAVITVTFLTDGDQNASTASSSSGLTGMTYTVAEATAGVGGANAADSISGGSGADVIYGGSGADTIVGGTEADRIIFSASAASNGADSISGFTAGSAGDILDFGLFLSSVSVKNATDASSGAYVSPTASALAADATATITISDDVYFIQQTSIASYDTASEIVTAMTTGGSAAWDAVRVGTSNKAVIVVADAEATTGYIYFIENDTSADIVTGEVTLVGTITSGTTNFINLMKAANLGL